MNEPQHIREILPDVMQDIRRRMELNRQKRILSAVSDYYQNRRQGCPCGRRRAKGGQKDYGSHVSRYFDKKFSVLSKIMLDNT